MNEINDAALLKMAEAEILGEAKRAAVRHSTAGISGWQPCPKPNKIFLTNTLLQAMSCNRIFSKKQAEKKGGALKPKKRDRKLLQKNNNERTSFIYKKPEKNNQKSAGDSSKKYTCKITKFKSKNKNEKEKNIKKLENSDNSKCEHKKIDSLR